MGFLDSLKGKPKNAFIIPSDMTHIWIFSTILPLNELPHEVTDEYLKEYDANIPTPKMKSFIGRSFGKALQEIALKIQTGAPGREFDAKVFQSEQLPPSEAGVEGYIRMFQKLRLGYFPAFIPWWSDPIKIEEQGKCVTWRFLVILWNKAKK
jgi:hypothetical protein